MSDKKRNLILLSVFLSVNGGMYYFLWNIEKSLIEKKWHFRGAGTFFQNPAVSQPILVIFGLTLGLIALFFLMNPGGDFKAGEQVIAGRIRLPRPQESSEYGRARFAAKGEQKKLFREMDIKKEKESIRELLSLAQAEKEKIQARYREVVEWEERYEAVVKLSEEEKKEAVKNLKKEKEDLLKKWAEEEETKEEKEKQEKAMAVIAEDFGTSTEDGGVILNWEKSGSRERIQVMNEDRHILIIGTTRSGKGRNVLLPSIGMFGFAGENMFVIDPKAENYLYTKDTLKRFGYQVIALDFREPSKSMHYNFLQLVIDAISRGELSAAVSLAWDMATQLVGEARGEKIWTNGEASVIAGAILAVVYDNASPERKKYQNMTNVYYFIVKGSEIVENEKTRLEIYEEALPYEHPAKAVFGIAKAAPDRTMGSFITSALTTLKLFTDSYIYNMTKDTEFSFSDLVKKKTAVFLILPDEKKTYHPVAALFLSMVYQYLVARAGRAGGRLPIRYNFLVDEYGNFPRLADMDAMLTAGAGRGIRFCLVIQDFGQINEKYGVEYAKTIRNNCEMWIYLKTDDEDTKAALSKRLGTYTIYNVSKSKNWDRNAERGGGGVSANYAARELLKTEEIGQINRPYFILFQRDKPFISYSPDLSEWIFNDIYGLGDKKYNQKVYAVRNFMRKEENEIAVEVSHPIQEIRPSGQKGRKETFLGNQRQVKARTRPNRERE